MKIQNLLLPKIGICTEEELFFRKEENYDREVELLQDQEALLFRNHGTCLFDTYFNSLSISKWKKYTNIGDVELTIYLQGDFEITLLNIELIGDNIARRVVDCQTVHCEDKTLVSLPYKVYEYKGSFTFQLKALSDNSLFFGGYYEAESLKDLKETNIALNICTFKRDPFILKNLDIIKRDIIENQDNPLHNHLHVYVSDNGHSLPIDELNQVNEFHVVQNKNVGGAGGFSRGLIEIMRNKNVYPATHALMMDDDIVIQPESLYRTYAMLCLRKDEYEDMTIGGAMLRIDQPAVQVEAGASWNAGKLVSNKSNLDVSELKNCLYNEVEEYCEFNAWWYCCTPMSVVNEENLPLPIFIRGDDLEYNLRNMKTLVLLNGICVWHEAFEHKYSSFLYYYILRNLLYDNSLHFADYSMLSFLKKLYGQVARELVYYRYKNIDLILRGVSDFYKGVDFLKATDGEALHKEIMGAGYKGVAIEELENAAFHLPLYMESMKEVDSRLHRVFRILTINGYILPIKTQKGKEAKIVSMSQSRPINYYRQGKILNYDPTSGKAFVTERSIKKAISSIVKLLSITFITFMHFSKAKYNFRQKQNEITNIKFWNNYLGE